MSLRHANSNTISLTDARQRVGDAHAVPSDTPSPPRCPHVTLLHAPVPGPAVGLTVGLVVGLLCGAADGEADGANCWRDRGAHSRTPVHPHPDCLDHGIRYDAYSPFGVVDLVSADKKWTPISMNHPAITKVAVAHPGYSAAQVILAWTWQHGIVTHPRTANPAHMRENLEAVGGSKPLELTDVEMAAITALAGPDCTHAKPDRCPTAGPVTAAGCCKICPITTNIP